MWFVNLIDKEELEPILEKYIKQAYKDWEYLRCRNLVKYLLKINPDNSVWLYYWNKLKSSLLRKSIYKWNNMSSWFSILTDIKIYLLVMIIIIFWKKKKH